MICHDNRASLEPIYLSTKTGRRELGHVKLCGGIVRGKGGDDSCYKVLGPIYRYKGGLKLTDEAWAAMMKVHPRPPYYFVEVGGRLVPEATAGQARIVDEEVPF